MQIPRARHCTVQGIKKRWRRSLTLAQQNYEAGCSGQERGLLALWVTNRERLRVFVERELLPAWGLELVATWHWVKVTDGGELVSPMVRKR